MLVPPDSPKPGFQDTWSVQSQHQGSPLHLFFNTVHICTPCDPLPTVLTSASPTTLSQCSSPLHLPFSKWSTSAFHVLLTLLTSTSPSTLFQNCSPYNSPYNSLLTLQPFAHCRPLSRLPTAYLSYKRLRTGLQLLPHKVPGAVGSPGCIQPNDAVIIHTCPQPIGPG